MQHYRLPIAALVSLMTLACGFSYGAENMNFDVSLFDQLRATKGNFVFSPTSVQSALAMAAVGARGATSEQMNRVLFGTTAATRPSQHVFQANSTVKMANSLWVQQGLDIHDDFKNEIVGTYHGELNDVDFMKDSSGATKKINGWVSTATNGKITDLFSSGSIRKSDRLILVNAIYFKAAWMEPFNPNQTRDDAFSVDGQTVQLPTMHGGMNGSYFEDDDVQLITLPYDADAGGLTMTILLPKKTDGLQAMEASLTADKLHEWESHKTGGKIELSLPKWKSKTSLGLVPALQAMGITDAFGNTADFSGITDTKLNIGGVLHQATIDVDETGTEATAATGIKMRAMAMRPMQRMTVKVDHPFLYLIQKNGSGPILFFGRVTDPRVTE